MAREMKDSGIQWLGAIPMDWEIGLLKRYCLCKTGSTPSTNNPEWFDGKIKWFTPGDFSDRYILSESNRTLSVKAKLDNVITIIPANTVLLVGIGATAGKIGLSKEECSCNQQITALITNKILPQYLMYWMIVNTTHLRETVMYTTLPIINNQTIGNYPIICPAPNEQKKIADYLDKKCAEIDALVTDIQSQIDILEDYKKSIITEAIIKGLNPNVEMKDSGIEWIGVMPKKWKCIKSKYIFIQRSERGNKISLELLSPTQKFGVIPQKLYEELTTNTAVKIQENTNLEMFKTIHKGDYCISLRSFQGGFEYSCYEGVVSPAYQVFYPIQNIYEGYYKYLFKSQSFINKINSYTMSLRDGKNIAFSDFGNTYIPVPPVDEQKKIADFLDLKCEEINNVIKDKNEQLDVLEQYKKSLIYEYVTGKKEVFVND